MSFRDPEWRALQAGEYVLGTLNARDTEEFEEELVHDYDLQQLVVEWQEEFQPLADAIPPVSPPLFVWQNIVNSIQQDKLAADQRRFAERSRRDKRKHQALHEKTGWQIFGSLAAAASVILGLMLWNQNRQPTAPDYDAIAILSAQDNKPLWIVDASIKDQKLRITTVAAPDIEDNQDHQLWMIKPDDGGVLSLGLLPKQSNTTIVIDTSGVSADAVALAVSLEPAGGSKQPAPSGPVLYQGSFNTLSEIRL